MKAWSPNRRVVKHAVASQGGVVASQNPIAAEVGASVLRVGGNAIDAAIATSLAIGVVEPWGSGLGGGGAMLIFHAAQNRVQAIDCGMVAPRRLDPADYPIVEGADPDLFGWPAVEEDRNIHGPLAMAMPSYLAGVDLAHRLYATRPLAELAEPAIALAREGLEVDWWTSLQIAGHAREFSKYADAARIWLDMNGLPPMPSRDGLPHRLNLDTLADTLQTLVNDGIDSFYRGKLALKLIADIEKLGGRLESDDFEAYEANHLPALELRHGDAMMFAMPGLFAGHSFARVFELLGQTDYGGPEPDADAYLAYAQALDQAYRERLEQQGDTETPEPSSTTHLSVVDRFGNMVACTQTLLSLFGSRMVLPETGILMNNGVMWFDPRPDRPNSMAPGKRPLSNMCPIIGHSPNVQFALGASGGRKILPAVAQLTSFLVDYRMDLEAAFAQPRIDVSAMAAIEVDAALPADVQNALAQHFVVNPQPNLPYPMGFSCPSGVLRDLSDYCNYGTAAPQHPWADAVCE
ncbi:MAG: gamma-glutamyltransferase [Pseudomonadota bacterium]